MRPLGTALFILAGGYLAVMALLFLVQRQLLYLPDREQPRPGLGLSEVTLETADGLQLLAWYAAGNPTVVYFHGNGGNIGYREERYRRLIAAGLGLLAVEYRGYGGNEGRPSEKGFYADARAALDFLDREGVAAGARVLYGESLGSAVAVKVASERPVGALVLEAPMTSVAELAQFHYPMFPARWLVRDRFDSLARIAAVGAPVLVLHGELDRVVPVEFGRRLYEAAKEPKEMRVFEGAGHEDLDHFGAIEAAAEFVRRVVR